MKLDLKASQTSPQHYTTVPENWDWFVKRIVITMSSKTNFCRCTNVWEIITRKKHCIKYIIYPNNLWTKILSSNKYSTNCAIIGTIGQIACIARIITVHKINPSNLNQYTIRERVFEPSEPLNEMFLVTNSNTYKIRIARLYQYHKRIDYWACLRKALIYAIDLKILEQKPLEPKQNQN